MYLHIAGQNVVTARCSLAYLADAPQTPAKQKHAYATFCLQTITLSREAYTNVRFPELSRRLRSHFRHNQSTRNLKFVQRGTDFGLKTLIMTQLAVHSDAAQHFAGLYVGVTVATHDVR